MLIKKKKYSTKHIFILYLFNEKKIFPKRICTFQVN